MFRGKRGKWLIAGLCVAVVLLVLLIVSLFVPAYGQICGPNEQSGKYECASYHLVFVWGWHVIKTFDSASAFVTAIATGLLAWITWLLVHLGQDQSRTTQAQLRAYVGVTNAGIRGVTEGEVPVAQFAVVNTGQTPAYDLYVLCDVTASIYPFPDDWASPLPQLRTTADGVHFLRAGVTYLGANQSLWRRLEMDRPVNADILQNLNGRTRAIYVYGVVRYRDVFGKFWELEFRYICGGEADTDTIYQDRQAEKECSERDHGAPLRLAGASFRWTAPPSE